MRSYRRFIHLRVAVVAAVAFSLVTPGLSPPKADAAPGDPSHYVAVGYQRLFTTGSSMQPALQAGETRDIRIAGTLGIPANVEGVLVDITVTSATANGTVQLWAAGAPRPGNGLVRFTPATTPQTNSAIIQPNASGLASIYNSGGNTQVNIDVQGYFTAGSGGAFTARRGEIVNTAAGLGAPSAVGNGAVISTQVSGPNIPSDATAVFANVSVVYPGSDGSLSFYGRSANPPSTTSLDFSAGSTDTAGFMIPLDATGGFKTRVLVGSGNVHLFIDIQGYFSGNDASLEGAFHIAPGTSVLGASPTGSGALQPGEARSFGVSGMTGVPAYGSEAVMVNVTVFNITQAGHIKLYGKGYVAPTVPLLAFSANETFGFASTSIVPVGLDGSLTVENTSAAPVSVSIRVQGWFEGHRAVAASAENSFINNAVSLGVPQNVAQLAVWNKDLADQMPQSVEVTTTPPASAIDDSAVMIEDGPEVETTPVTNDNPVHEVEVGPVTEEESETIETPVELRGAEQGSCRPRYRLQRLTEYVMIESVTNLDLYWIQLDKRWCASRTLHKVGSYFTTQSADVTAAADTFIDDEGTITDGLKDEWLKYDGIHTKSGHFSQRVRRFRYCAVKGIPFCYNTELAQAATVAYDWSHYSSTFKW